MAGTVPNIGDLRVEYQTEEQVLSRARRLPGMTFRDVLELGIAPEGVSREYNSRRYKGGMGNLIEERFFGYRANDDRAPDFAEAGVELKVTCVDARRDGSLVAGERIVLTMIPFDEELPEELSDSHLWEKCARMLIVWYRRDRSVDPYDQEILYARMFTPPEEDLRVIEEDYRAIARLVREGRADELSESQTNYLGACTKGATRAKSMREQSYYAPGKVAHRRAFSLKRPYVDYVLNHYVMGEPEPEPVAVDPREARRRTVFGAVTATINAHAGETDRELCASLGIGYSGNKAQWTTIVYRLLGVRGERAAEFEKAGVRVRTLRAEHGLSGLRESVPVLNIDFASLAGEDLWEDSALYALLSETRFLFVVFEKGEDAGDPCRLLGCVLWGMPADDLDGPARRCWELARDCVRRGPALVPRARGGFSNDLPKISDGLCVHVRPRAQQSAYRLSDGPEVGNVERDAEPLPDGRWMTRQTFWLSAGYVLDEVRKLLVD